MTNTSNFANRTIGEIVAEDHRMAVVFKRYDIDFCCGGKRSLGEECARRGIDIEEIGKALTEAGQMPAGRSANYQEWSLDFLIDYIVNKHHLYVREVLPQIREYAAKVANRHGNTHPETIAIANLFEELAIDLMQHLQKEEVILFPYVRQLEHARREKGAFPRAPFGSVNHPIQMMEMEHEFAGEHMHRIRELSQDFTPPPDACNTYRVLYTMLRDFEDDLHEHVHLENNILFPKAETLERTLIDG